MLKKRTHEIRNPESRNPGNEKSLAFRLYYALKSRNLLAIDICRMAKIGKSTLSLYLHGKSSPSLERVIVLAQALRVKPEWLQGLTPLTAINSYNVDDPCIDEELEKIKDIWLGLNEEGKKHLINTAELLFESQYFTVNGKNTN